MAAMTALFSDPITERDLQLRVAYGGGQRELLDGCLVITRPVGHFTRDDLDDLPTDGRKHELLDGQIVVSPGARPLHQRVVTRLVIALSAALPPGLEVLAAPVDVHIPGPLPSTLLPDVIVVPTVGADTVDVERPLLAVEVLSPSTRRFDLGRKQLAYARVGIGIYAVVDPVAPSITIWALVAGAYRQVAHGDGEQVVRVPAPVELAMSAAALVRSAGERAVALAVVSPSS